MSESEIVAFVEQQKQWLEAELNSSRQEAADAGRKNGSTQTDKAKNSLQNKNNGSAEEGRSRVLTGLEITQVSVGLYGRTVIEVGVASSSSKGGGADNRLPAHRFTTGDEVELRAGAGSGGSSTNKTRTTQGVVSFVSDSNLAFAISGGGKERKKNTNKNRKGKDGEDGNDDDDDDPDQPFGEPPFTLVPSSSVEVHRKIVAALSTLAQHGAQHPHAGYVVQALFEPTLRSSSETYNESATSFKSRLSNPNLDDSQVEAIQFALQPDRVVSLIHGPPGTGKTTTIVELIRQAVTRHRWRVLVTAPSNVAVDNVLAKLVATNGTNKKERLRVVRLGHPARLQTDILPYSLEAQVQASDGTEIVQDVRKELANYLKLMSHHKYETRATARREVRQLRKEVRQREEGVVKSILQNAQVVLATTVGAASKILSSSPIFDLVVIDEAAQALEASCWIPILQGRRLVLAGDHCQLPPTIQSSEPKVMQGLGCTLFERLMYLYGDHLPSSNQSTNFNKDNSQSSLASVSVPGKVSRMLKVQYRMNRKIADWASRALYGGQLETHTSCAEQTLIDILNVESSNEDIDDFRTPFLLIDTAGCGLHEQVNAAGSRLNPGEAQIVQQHIEKLIRHGVAAQQIAVITPYNGQVETLRSLLLPDNPKLEIRSVDGFQGGERPVVVLSLVRSSARGGMDGIGFLKDDRRLNVAVTRAQRHCCVVTDSETVSQSPFVKNLVEWIEEHGEARSALEFLQEFQINGDLAAADLELSHLMQQDQARKDKQSSLRPTSGVELNNELAKTVKEFADAAVPGSELRLSSELSSRDRRGVHELAEMFGIEHRSEGTNNVDRFIILSIPDTRGAGVGTPPNEENVTPNEVANDRELELDTRSTAVDTPLNEEYVPPDEIANDRDVELTSHTEPSTFDLLQVSDEDEQEKDEDFGKDTTRKGARQENSLLRDLAKERELREKPSHRPAANILASKVNPTKSLPKQDQKSKGKKLGGTKKNPSGHTAALDDLDDMAFLDAQIDQVQNSHGRRVEGKGSYKSIVNGILIAKPKERGAPKNTRASAALQSKLKESQDGRKAKPKKKK